MSRSRRDRPALANAGRCQCSCATRGPAQRIAQGIGLSRPTVWRWQQRFAEAGVEGLLRDKTRKPGKAPIAADKAAQLVVGGIVVENDMDRLASCDLALDSIEEADEFEMAVALHAAADHRAVEHAERGEQGGGAVPLVVVRHGLAASGLHRQSG